MNTRANCIGYKLCWCRLSFHSLMCGVSTTVTISQRVYGTLMVQNLCCDISFMAYFTCLAQPSACFQKLTAYWEIIICCMPIPLVFKKNHSASSSASTNLECTFEQKNGLKHQKYVLSIGPSRIRNWLLESVSAVRLEHFWMQVLDPCELHFCMSGHRNQF